MQSSQPASNSYNLFIVQTIFTKQPLFCTPDGFATILAVSFGTCCTQPQDYKEYKQWAPSQPPFCKPVLAFALYSMATRDKCFTKQALHYMYLTQLRSQTVVSTLRLFFREVLCLLISWSKDLQRCSLMVRALAKPAKPCLIPLQQFVQPACRHTHFLTNLSARKCSPHCG